MEGYRYAYLFGALLLGIVWIFFFVTRKDLRKEMLYMSFLIGILGLTEHFFFSRYWQPEFLINIIGLNIGLESILLCFFYGGVGSVIYDTFTRNYYKRHSANDIHVKRHVYILIAVLTGIAATVAISLSTQLSLVLASSIGMCISGLILTLFFRRILIPSLVSGTIFMILVALIQLATIYVFPNVNHLFWQEEYLLGVWVIGIPIEEFIFHFSLGFFIGFLYEFTEGLILIRKPKSS